jgi:(R)-2-hydroxyacyl-CoA dehydratese activating ATPase
MVPAEKKLPEAFINQLLKEQPHYYTRIGIADDVAFVGGVAKNSAMQSILEETIKKKINVPDHPQIIGALGCAIA